MNWITPMVGLVGAGIAVPTLLILYFLRLKRRDLEVSSTLLWKKAVQDLQANAPFQRLRRNLLLFLQLIVLAAALAAVAQPQWMASQGSIEKCVILIDRSASMSAMDQQLDGRAVTRLESAKAQAESFIDSLPTGGLFESTTAGEAMIIAFDASAEVIQTFTANKGALKSAVRAISPTDASTSIDEAARLATAYVGPKVIENVGMQAGAPLFIWSDGAIPDIARLKLHPDTRIDYRAVGRKETANVAITAMRAERPYDKPDDLAVFVGVQSTDPAPVTADLELAINGTAVGIKAVSLPAAKPGEAVTSGAVFRLTRQERGVVGARLVREDALAADNRSQIVVPAAKRLNVALVTDGNLFLEAGLGGLALNSSQVLSPAQFAALVSSGRIGDFDVFVMDRVNPANPMNTAAQGPMPPGRFLIFGVVPPMRGLSPGLQPDEPQPDVPADWVRDHPALQLISLDGLVVAKPLVVNTDDNARVIARGTRGPFVVDVAQDAARAVIVCFDVLASNWAFDVGFVLFLASSVAYLGQDDAAAEQQLGVGGMLTTSMPDGVGRAELRAPDGKRSLLITGQDGRVSFGPTSLAGLYELTWNGKAGPRDDQDGGSVKRTFAVNLFDPSESDLGSRPTLDLPSGSIAAVSGGGARQGLSRLWPWLLLSAVAVVMLEWLIYNRKTYV